MGAFSGSVTFTKFYAQAAASGPGAPEGDAVGDPSEAHALPEGFRERFVEAIQLRAFRPLRPEEDDEQRAGWVAIEHPFDLELLPEKVYFNDYLNLGLRVDRWRIPSPLFRATFAEAERALLAERGLSKLTRSQKQDLQDTVMRQLRRKVVPAMKVVDLSWHLPSMVVRFFHPSPSMHEVLADLFEQTFGYQLLPESPYVLAEERGLPEALLARFPQLSPVDLSADAMPAANAKASPAASALVEASP